MIRVFIDSTGLLLVQRDVVHRAAGLPPIDDKLSATDPAALPVSPGAPIGILVIAVA